MKKVTVRISDDLHAEIEQAVKRTGFSFQKVVAGYLAKDNLVSLMAAGAKTATVDIADAISRLDRKLEARLLSIEDKIEPGLARPAMGYPGGMALDREALLVVVQAILEATPLSDKQRVKALADRVKAEPENREAISELLSELERLLVDDRQGNYWKNSLRSGIEKLRKGE